MMNTNTEVIGLEAFESSDQNAIRSTLRLLLEGFVRRDAQMLNDVYAEDADWVNAFGTVKHGRADIVAYLTGLFSDTNFGVGQMSGPPRSVARYLSDQIATVSSHLQITGQGLLAGGEIDLRDNYSLRILQKSADGRWLIVSEMYMDVRQDRTYSS